MYLTLNAKEAIITARLFQLTYYLNEPYTFVDQPVYFELQILCSQFL